MTTQRMLIAGIALLHYMPVAKAFHGVAHPVAKSSLRTLSTLQTDRPGWTTTPSRILDDPKRLYFWKLFGDPQEKVDSFPADYAVRAAAFGFASPAEIRKLLDINKSGGKESSTIILDVRRQDEIDANGEITYPRHAYTRCTPDECPDLSTNPESVLPNKNVPVVVHCASGKRAAKAAEILRGKGYQTVVNAGGLADLRATLAEKD